MIEPDWLKRARKEGRILSENGVAPPPIVPEAVAEEESEKSFQNRILKFAKEHLWAAYHTHDSRKSQAGFPDLVLWRERLILAELKSESGRLTAPQQTAIEQLTLAHQEVYVWRPSDWPAIQEVLTRRGR